MVSFKVSITFFVVAFILAMPFGMLELISLGKYDFFSKKFAPAVTFYLVKFFGARGVRYPVLIFAVAFSIWFIVNFWWLAIIFLLFLWVNVVCGRLMANAAAYQVATQYALTAVNGVNSALDFISGGWAIGTRFVWRNDDLHTQDQVPMFERSNESTPVPPSPSRIPRFSSLQRSGDLEELPDILAAAPA